MKTARKELKTIDDYISIQEESKQIGLQKMRAIIKKVAPNTIEGISYQMPVFKQNGNLVYFAVSKKHYGFYPTSKPIEVFKDQLISKGYTFSKGAIQFSCDQPLPVKLIQDIVKFRIKDMELNANTKKKIPTKK
jgi:uncharacterized protein YdhG (YjbR/CyaY superfamily)